MRAILVIAFLCIVPAPAAPQSPTPLVVRQQAKEVVFSTKTSDPVALAMADKLLEHYLEAIGVYHLSPREFFGNDRLLARYLPLDKSAANRFVALYLISAPGTSCPRIGCDILLFENSKGADWRLVLQVSTHKMLIGSAAANSPGDIFTELPGVGNGAAGDFVHWRWTGSRYDPG